MTLAEALERFPCPKCSGRYGSSGLVKVGHSFGEGSLYMNCHLCQRDAEGRFRSAGLRGFPLDVASRLIDDPRPVRFVAEKPDGGPWQVTDRASGEAVPLAVDLQFGFSAHEEAFELNREFIASLTK